MSGGSEKNKEGKSPILRTFAFFILLPAGRIMNSYQPDLRDFQPR